MDVSVWLRLAAWQWVLDLHAKADSSLTANLCKRVTQRVPALFRDPEAFGGPLAQNDGADCLLRLKGEMRFSERGVRRSFARRSRPQS